MRVHFIAIGGSAMHNLAIALHNKGYHVSGSDDEIFEPSKSRLQKFGLLPATEGWDVSRVTMELDSVILGMHAKPDNPELLKAKELGLKIFSYPEYLYEQSKDKKRVVIGGSHGKTTITAMILHVLRMAGIDCDYMVGAQLEGFDVMVRLSEHTGIMVFEGDEYLTSPIDRRPKFHLYKPDIALLSGVAWDHINVFPTFDNYVEQFREFIRLITPGGTLIYCADDETLCRISPGARKDLKLIPYSVPEYFISDGVSSLIDNGKAYPLKVFGRHNMMNLNGARWICLELGVSDELFISAIQSFKGASKRLELISGNYTTTVYKDFAHAPSKVKATLHAVKEQYPSKTIVACLELHTYSSLSKEFLGHYFGSLNEANVPLVYFSPHAIQLKRLPPITKEQVKEGFGNSLLEVFTDSKELRSRLLGMDWNNSVLLLMSSGDYDGIDLGALAEEITRS
ncbi:MAG: Mur ligase family protein [Bacteroidetes bacterium]|nr:Mur ligase family protein [Bacteroidota bacterium]